MGVTDTSGGDPEGDDESDLEDLLEHLEGLEDRVDSREEQTEVREALRLARGLSGDGFLGERIRKYTTRDMAESFVGAVLFAVPLLVEDGVFDIAAHLVSTRVVGIPVFFVANAAFVVVMTYGLLYWADFQLVQVSRPILGVIPRRLAGVLVISFLTAAGLMTMWGRVEGWADPEVALARISVVWAVSSFGGALGDILPGESHGEDIGDLIDDIG